MKICIFGDAMQDEDIHCKIVKYQGEMPVLMEKEKICRPGGAGNVKRMCQALGVITMLCSNDPKLLVKRRLFADGKVFARYDTELKMHTTISVRQLQLALEFKPDAIIIADHGKGFITNHLMNSLPNDIPIFIDSFSTTPILNSNSITWVGSEQELPAGITGRRVVKQGSVGLTFFDGNEHWFIDSTCTNCVDPLGAGDQFIVCLAVARLEGMDWLGAIYRANKAAGEQCCQMGILPLTEF